MQTVGLSIFSILNQFWAISAVTTIMINGMVMRKMQKSKFLLYFENNTKIPFFFSNGIDFS